MATNSHKRRAGDEHLGFQSVSVRVRSAARVDPFESLMATKGRPAAQGEGMIGAEDGTCSHCTSRVPCTNLRACARCSDVLCTLCTVDDYQTAEVRAFCLDCHDAQRKAAAQGRGSPPGETSAAQTPWRRLPSRSNFAHTPGGVCGTPLSSSIEEETMFRMSMGENSHGPDGGALGEPAPGLGQGFWGKAPVTPQTHGWGAAPPAAPSFHGAAVGGTPPPGSYSTAPHEASGGVVGGSMW